MRTRVSRMSFIVVRELWLPALMVTAWYVLSEKYNNPFFPPLSKILERFKALWLFDGVPQHVVPSLRNWIIGILIALVLGIISGIVFGLFPRIYRIIEPPTELFRSVPGLALMPLALLMFGIGPKMAIPLVVYAAFWPIFLNTMDGIKSIEPLLNDGSRVYRLPFGVYFKNVLLPAASPQITVGVRQALSVGIAVIFFSEMIGAFQGIGYVTLAAQRTFQTADMWAGILLLGILGYVVNLSFHLLEQKLLFWHSSVRELAN